MKRKKLSKAHRKKISDSMKGIIVHSKEHRKNLSKSLSGRKLSEEHKESIKKFHKRNGGSYLKGKDYDEAFGKDKSKKIKKKISKKLKGHKLSKESIEKMKKNINKGFKNGRTVWNKGLTKETDSRINKSATTMKNNIKKFNNMRLGAIKRIKKQNGQISPSYSIDACKFFKEIDKKYNLNGQHAEHKGEYHIKELGYFLDYYEPELNLIIEWNENKHYDNGRLTAKHLTRQDQIKRKLKCTFINIRQKTFNKERIFKRIEKSIRSKKIKLIS